MERGLSFRAVPSYMENLFCKHTKNAKKEKKDPEKQLDECDIACYDSRVVNTSRVSTLTLAQARDLRLILTQD